MRSILATAFLCAAGLQAAGPCNNATIKGDYGILVTGTRPSGPGGPIEDFVVLIHRRYDGNGGFSEVHNVKGAIAGVVLDEPGLGTYQVNADCTGSATVLPTATRPFPIGERLIVVSDGDEILAMTPTPAPLLSTSRQTRVSGSASSAALATVRGNIQAIARRLGLVPQD